MNRLLQMIIKKTNESIHIFSFIKKGHEWQSLAYLNLIIFQSKLQEPARLSPQGVP